MWKGVLRLGQHCGLGVMAMISCLLYIVVLFLHGYIWLSCYRIKCICDCIALLVGMQKSSWDVVYRKKIYLTQHVFCAGVNV
jgi:hypothetical protein